MFSFIPDSSMVGTVFVNAIANAYVAVSNNAQLTLTLNDNTSFGRYVNISQNLNHTLYLS
jgi:hypothetical protein